MAPVMRDPPLCTLADLDDWDPVTMRSKYSINQLADFHEAMAEEAENRRLNEPKKKRR
jgi:hypothetical protein